MTLIRSCLAGVGVVALITFLMLANAAHGGEAYCEACQGDSGWSGEKALDQIGNPNAVTSSSTVMPGLSTAQKNRVGIWKQPLAGFTSNNTTDEGKPAPEKIITVKEAAKTPVQSKPAPLENATVVRSAGAGNMLVPMEDVSDTDVLLDISENENATEHIRGSIAIPYTNFLDNSSLKSVPEITKILGDAGISRSDSVVIYGECMPCGGGPAPATFVYWMMKSLGHENVRVLDGTLENWTASGKPIAKEVLVKPPKNYTSQFAPDLIASYDLVKSGSAQIVDARTMEEFGIASIPGAINIPYDGIIRDGKIRDEARLARVFAILNKNQPVVVYTNTGIKGSVVWFALELLGYDARLYSYMDYRYNQMESSPSDMGNATL